MTKPKEEMDLGSISMQPVQSPSLWEVFKLSASAKPPKAGTEYSAGYDITACIELGKDVKYFTADSVASTKTPKEFVEFDGAVGLFIEPGQRVLIPTGLQFQVAEEYYVQLYPRSGLSIKEGLSLGNCVAVIDSDYVDEVFVPLINVSTKRVFVKHGDKICQAILAKRLITETEIKTSKTKLSKITSRNGGFGSTGK